MPCEGVCDKRLSLRLSHSAYTHMHPCTALSGTTGRSLVVARFMLTRGQNLGEVKCEGECDRWAMLGMICDGWAMLGMIRHEELLGCFGKGLGER